MQIVGKNTTSIRFFFLELKLRESSHEKIPATNWTPTGSNSIQTPMAAQVELATSQPKNKCVVCSVWRLQIGHNMSGMSKPRLWRLSLVGIRSSKTHHIRILTFRGTRLFQQAESCAFGRTTLSIHCLVNLTEKIPFGSKIHHHRSLSEDKVTFFRRADKASSYDCSAPPLTWRLHCQNQVTLFHRSDIVTFFLPTLTFLSDTFHIRVQTISSIVSYIEKDVCLEWY